MRARTAASTASECLIKFEVDLRAWKGGRKKEGVSIEQDQIQRRPIGVLRSASCREKNSEALRTETGRSMLAVHRV